MKENFDFDAWAHLPGGNRTEKLHVVVRGTTVTLHNVHGRLAAGVWDAGGYVRFPRGQRMDVSPQLLDEIDKELRRQMTTKGVQERAPELRRSAVGYSNR